MAAALEALGGLTHVHVRGLMAIPPIVERADDSRRRFQALRRLAERHGLDELSMGMSADFEVAIEEGATMVRVGTAIFGRTHGRRVRPMSVKRKKVGFIGAGNMGEALIKGLVAASLVPAEAIYASDVRLERLRALEQRYGVQLPQDNAELVRQVDIVILAVKPQIMARTPADRRCRDERSSSSSRSPPACRRRRFAPPSARTRASSA